MNLYKYVSDAINEKLGFAANLETPRNRDFGDFSTNAAMVGAKIAHKNPRELAAEILPKLQELDFVASAEIAGPGFINIKIRDDFILKNATAPQAQKAEQPLVIDMDYGAYNVAKSLHIGHLRTSIVGDTLNRIFRFMGHKTISYNHIGDWGKPMGLVIAWIERLHPELPYFQDNFDATQPVDYDIDANELNTYYPAASALAKQDPKFQAHAQEIKAKFQAGHPGYFALYEKFLAISLDNMNKTVQRLNILPFDYDLGERNAAKYLSEVEKILNSKNMIYESDGAMVINVRRDTDNAPMPPYMWRDSRGADTYDSTDLAALYYRKLTDNPNKIIYLTDFRQSLHFQQLFRVAEIAGIFDTKNIEHIGYGTINGRDGKPFKTRDGSAAGLDDILDIANNAVRARIAESDKQLDDNTIETIGLAAVKFNDLIHDVKSDYIFDPDSVTSFEGRTGPYVLYTAVRLNSVLKRATKQPKLHDIAISADERNLLLAIMDFDRTIQSAYENRATDMIANYAYNLCQLINAFYHTCPILRDDIDEQTQENRLYITKLARDTLATATDLMGLKIPEKM
ncbi:MAG: arginine--tRNA ligase [Alphaproteobacteria bacterium]|nr:arginine--tRNA ligase [Alphaproteobacteria bacterium]